MGIFNSRRRMWIIVIAVCLVALGALTVASQLNTGLLVPIGAIAFTLVGAVFCWMYSTDRDALWWAIIPGLGAFTLAAALLADRLFGEDPANDWVSGWVVGVGAAITAAFLKRVDARTVLVFVAMFSLLVGIAMAPLTTLLKVILIAGDILVAVYTVVRIRRTPTAAG